MTQFSDDLFLGAANFAAGPGFPNQGFGRTALPFGYGGIGVGPMGRVFYYDIVPLTKNATAFAASQSPGSAGLALSAGTGVTAVVDLTGTTRYTADVARAVTVTSGGNDTGINFLVRGYDIYGQPMSEAITGASGAAATGKKAFISVVSITPSGAVATTATAGTSDVFGLPVALTDGGYLQAVKWNAGTGLSNDAGTLVLAVATPANTTTGDVRGTYTPSSSSDGVKRLVLSQILPGSQSGPTATPGAVLGVTQA